MELKEVVGLISFGFSMSAVKYTKSFVISVVLGKDVVPRIGLHQLEHLRADMINVIKRSVDPKVVYYILQRVHVQALFVLVENHSL